jgi:hypothetical protein
MKSKSGWRYFYGQSLLGESLRAQGKLEEAESLLKEGYEGMKQRERIIPSVGQLSLAEARIRLAEAQRRLARLYYEWGQPEKGDEWRKKMATGNSTAVPNQ